MSAKKTQSENRAHQGEIEIGVGLAEAVLNASAAATVLLATDGCIRSLNSVACSLFACTQAEVIGENWLHRFAPAGRLEKYTAILEKSISDTANPVVLQGLDELHNASRDLLHVHCLATSLTDANGAVSGVICSIEDRTDLHELAQELDSSRRTALLANLAGDIAHNFNNLLQLVYGNAQLLQLAAVGDTEQIERILEATERGTLHIRSMMAFTSRQRGATGRVDVVPLVTGMVELLQYSMSRRIQIIASIKLQTAVVMADPSEIEAAILRLAIGARQAMIDGGSLTIDCDRVTITDSDIRHVPGRATGEFVCLSMRASATGLTVGQIDGVFAGVLDYRESDDDVSDDHKFLSGGCFVDQHRGDAKIARIDFYLPCADEAPGEADGTSGEADLSH